MAQQANVEVVIKGKDQASTAMGKVGKSADQMAAKFAKAGGIMMGVGVGMLAATMKMVTGYAKAGDEVAKMAKRTGIATEALSEMRHVAEISGTSLDSFETGIKRMQRTITEADSGMAEYARTFEDLGLSIDSIVAMKPEDQFWTIANAIGAIEDPTRAAAMAQDVFGRSGTELMPILIENTENIAALRQEAHDLGVVFDEEAAAAAERQVDAMTNLKTSLEGLRNAFAEAVMPAITDFVEMITDKVIPAMNWLKEHPEVAQAFVKFGAIFAIGGAVFLAIAGFIKLLTMLRTALIITQAFMGPAGWTALGIGASIAAGYIASGMIMGYQEEKQRKPETVLPYKEGAGPPPVGSRYAAREETPPPQGFASWEAYDQYRKITGNTAPPSFAGGGFVGGPLGSPQPVIAHGGEYIGRGGGVVVNVGGSVVTERELIDAIHQGLLKMQSRNFSTGIA